MLNNTGNSENSGIQTRCDIGAGWILWEGAWGCSSVPAFVREQIPAFSLAARSLPPSLPHTLRCCCSETSTSSQPSSFLWLGNCQTLLPQILNPYTLWLQRGLKEFSVSNNSILGCAALLTAYFGQNPILWWWIKQLTSSVLTKNSFMFCSHLKKLKSLFHFILSCGFPGSSMKI